MRICRFESEGEIQLGVLEGEGWVQPVRGDPFGALDPEGSGIELAGVRLLAPVLPSKILAVGQNYRAHAEEMGKPIPAEPLLFLKATTALWAPGMTIRLPRESERVDHEAELAVVIGKRARRIAPEQAREHVLGFTCMNDVTARDIQKREIQFTRAKGFDTFAPLGPWIDTGFDPLGKAIRCRVDGEERQAGSTNDMLFDVWQLVSFASQAMTLLPGDVISTGTPEGVGPLRAGEVVEVEVEGLGVLRNPVGPEEG